MVEAGGPQVRRRREDACAPHRFFIGSWVRACFQ